MTINAEVNPVVAEVVRSGFTESRHRGTVAGLAADGRLVIGVGRTDAEGVDAFALDDGHAGAVKIDDGGQRARIPVTVAALRLLGAAVPDDLATVPVTGGDGVVGQVRAVGWRG